MAVVQCSHLVNSGNLVTTVQSYLKEKRSRFLSGWAYTRHMIYDRALQPLPLSESDSAKDETSQYACEQLCESAGLI